MKKKLVGILSVTMCALLSVSLAACGKNKHEAKTAWESDAAKHWHLCATEGHTDKLNEAEHVWNDGEITAAATEEADGVKTYTCTVCEYKKTEAIPQLPHTHKFDTNSWGKDGSGHWHKATCEHTAEISDKAAHTFGNWTEKTPANHVDKVEKRTCTVCLYEEERTVPNSAIHDYENVKSDAENHWFECECGAKAEIEKHTFGDWAEKTAAGVDQDRQYSRKCTECQYEAVLTFDNTKTNGTYCVAIKEVFAISGKKVIQGQVLRGTIEVGDNLAFEGVDGEFNIDAIKKNKVSVQSASYGESVELTVSANKGSIDDITNNTSTLASQPGEVNAYNKFTAVIKIDKGEFSENLSAGIDVYLDLHDVGHGMIPCKLTLPEGVSVAQDGKSYNVTITIPKNVSKWLWAGMQFKYKIYDSASSSNITIATGTVLSTIA